MSKITTIIFDIGNVLVRQRFDELAEEVLAVSKRYGRANWDAIHAAAEAEEAEA